jgi:2',3'-cyclic-nucleotide 2'-phosphodiesterase (5'-nucleotidase family)
MGVRHWLVGAAGAWMLAGFASGAAADTQSLTLLHDNDIHGHLRSFCYIEVAKGPDEHCDVGGAARRATLVKMLRAKATAPIFLIDSGDTATRGPLATEYEGQDEIAAMNAIGYDLAAVGNNEFKLKDAEDIRDAAGAQAALGKLVAGSKFPWICANATLPDGSLLPGVQPFIVRRFGKLRVAFLGLTTGRSAAYPQTKGLTITDPVAAAKVWIPKARAQADVVIAVTHIGVADDERLVRETTGLDAVVGGDSHTYLYKPVEWTNAAGQAVPIVQDGEFGVRLGVFDLTFEGDAASGWKLARYDDTLVPVGMDLRPDPKLAALVARYAQPLDVVVGHVPAIGATPAARAAQTTETLAAAWKSATGADVGLQTDGGLFEVFRTPAVTRFQVRAVMPFHDGVWTGTIAGSDLKALLARPGPLGAVHATIGAADIDPARTYTIAATDFTFQTLKLKGDDTHLDARVAIERWLAKAPA